jgi:protein-S-isoprenylcysteine O-methyltransferase Ste14
MIDILFLIALILELVYLALFLLTIRSPALRFWPPPSARSWQFFASWSFAGLVAAIFILLGLLDYDAGPLSPFWGRLPIALAFFIPGSIIGTWASLTFPFRATIGLPVRLITHGPYRFSRNPQYVSDMLNAVGYVILTNSWRVAILGLFGVALNLLAPFTEEPWLEAQYGEGYRRYKQQVPRFIGRRTRPDAA